MGYKPPKTRAPLHAGKHSTACSKPPLHPEFSHAQCRWRKGMVVGNKNEGGLCDAPSTASTNVLVGQWGAANDADPKGYSDITQRSLQRSCCMHHM